MNNEGRKALIKEMTMSDLPPYCLDAANIMGIEAFVRLSDELGGTSFYVPKFDNVIARARDRIIVKQFNGNNYKELALQYNLSEMLIRNIITKEQIEKNQISLFQDKVNL